MTHRRRTSTENLLKDLDDVAEEVGRTWPKEVSAVEAIKEDRKKLRQQLKS